MKRFRMVLFMLATASLYAADPTGFGLWTGATLKSLGERLGPKINAQNVATDQLGSYGNHSIMAVHREGNGEAEVHESQVDVFVVQSGQASLIIGGTVIGGKTTAPGEIRGTSIQGGEKKRLSPGDIVHVPPKTPHQVLVEAGKKFNYLIVKIDAK